jgi:PilZ domain
MASILKQEADHEERRNGRRQRVLKDGKIVFNLLGSVVDCTIRDLSEFGAKLMCKDWRAVPEEFSLVTLTDGQMRDAQVRWRQGSLIGIAFTGAPRRAPPRKW